MSADMTPLDDDLVFIGDDDEPFTTTLVIAAKTNNEHESVVRIIRDNLDDFEEFGVVRFEIGKPSASQNGGGRPVKYAVLTEPQSALAITYLRNNAKVRDFKKRLIRDFYTMRRLLAERFVQPLKGSELMAAGYAEAMKTLEARDSRIHQLESKIIEDAPKVGYIDQYVTDADCLLFSTVASTNNVKESWLRELLIAKNWMYVQTDSRWSHKENKKVERNRYSEKSDKKRYFRRVPVHDAPRFRGSEVMHTLKITPAGAEAIYRLIAKEMAA
jgi:phage regulator Rha-like protein